VHNLQAQLGCFAGSEDHQWQWLFEGMATQLAYAALIDADLVTAEDAELAIWEYRGLQDDNGTLADYERSSDEAGDAYGLFHLAARGLFERVESPRAFAEFCRVTASGADWRGAFERSFGVTVPEHYAAVERERSRLRAEQGDAAAPGRSGWRSTAHAGGLGEDHDADMMTTLPSSVRRRPFHVAPSRSASWPASSSECGRAAAVVFPLASGCASPDAGNVLRRPRSSAWATGPTASSCCFLRWRTAGRWPAGGRCRPARQRCGDGAAVSGSHREQQRGVEHGVGCRWRRWPCVVVHQQIGTFARRWDSSSCPGR
jgi:hypothetical protein